MKVKYSTTIMRLSYSLLLFIAASSAYALPPNCAPNSGAKRRDDINSLIMTSPVPEEQPVVDSQTAGVRGPEDMQQTIAD